ncbi:uncharacterized protein MONBRDRAFT_30267 [Monosiga brevicollis MX1]|uniref:Uncharacterized protein n=1 Tax=Monosiga brevicollis TaxID=81824 RepID=A9VDH0_MONBE|nr:uncharacterized protein MONBRDRAFT_30267 [Monosiga brevicollis MX1]EDQ84473.1 predicted protein [Monosiga brevicollis MX1]|eukprot:XP_001750768.1 hypothetical protein [Monosiga brevicollis MX1]
MEDDDQAPQPYVLLSIIAATLVGTVGVLPILVVPANQLSRRAEDFLDARRSFKAAQIEIMLRSGDDTATPQPLAALAHPHSLADPNVATGLALMAGVLAFFFLEKMATMFGEGDHPSSPHADKNVKRVSITGYLNILVNLLDNFTHGLAVATAFSISYETGVMTTAAVIAHEIPHEVGDYAILIRSGFSVYDAIKSQLLTSFGSIAGAVVALSMDTHSTKFLILPFTAGGFLYVALVSLLPDLLEPHRSWPWFADVASVLGGIAIVTSTMLLES